MPLKKVNYTDSDGRLKAAWLPESEPDNYAEFRGIPIGPPDLSELELPLEVEVRLNNQLYHRGIIEPLNAFKQRSEIFAALQAALKVDAERIYRIYSGGLNGHATEKHPKEQSNSPLPNRRPRQSR